MAHAYAAYVRTVCAPYVQYQYMDVVRVVVCLCVGLWIPYHMNLLYFKFLFTKISIWHTKYVVRYNYFFRSISCIDSYYISGLVRNAMKIYWNWILIFGKKIYKHARTIYMKWTLRHRKGNEFVIQIAYIILMRRETNIRKKNTFLENTFLFTKKHLSFQFSSQQFLVFAFFRYFLFIVLWITSDNSIENVHDMHAHAVLFQNSSNS